ncbi:hypothetical protein CHARACLAT_027487, partial [Characodon lateralis]|nr:hypothetical protein [Characodon lateralis]
GVNMFYICIIVYLYGDLAIYAAAVPISLMEVACGNHSCSAGGVKYNDTDPCWGSVTRKDAYRVFLPISTPNGAYSVALHPVERSVRSPLLSVHHVSFVLGVTELQAVKVPSFLTVGLRLTVFICKSY